MKRFIAQINDGSYVNIAADRIVAGTGDYMKRWYDARMAITRKKVGL